MLLPPSRGLLLGSSSSRSGLPGCSTLSMALSICCYLGGLMSECATTQTYVEYSVTSPLPLLA